MVRETTLKMDYQVTQIHLCFFSRALARRNLLKKVSSRLPSGSWTSIRICKALFMPTSVISFSTNFSQGISLNSQDSCEGFSGCRQSMTSCCPHFRQKAEWGFECPAGVWFSERSAKPESWSFLKQSIFCQLSSQDGKYPVINKYLWVWWINLELDCQNIDFKIKLIPKSDALDMRSKSPNCNTIVAIKWLLSMLCLSSLK